MAGQKKKGVPVNSQRKKEKRARSQDREMEEHGNKRKQRKSRSPSVGRLENKRSKSGRKNEKYTARFVEDDNVVEIEADGQTTEFADDEANLAQVQRGRRRDRSGLSGRQDSSTERSTASMSEESDDEVILSQGAAVSRNNNATNMNRSYEEGECSQEEEARGQGQASIAIPSASQATLMEDTLNQTMNRMQNYVDEKFAENYVDEKYAEIERELAEKTRLLQELKEKGKINNSAKQGINKNTQNLEDDIESELTIYRNAVKRGTVNRGSSSSEDLINTSDELNAEEVAPEFNPYLSERQLEKEKEQRNKHRNRDEEMEARDDRYYEEDEERRAREREQLQRDKGKDKSDRLLRDAEAGKARIYDIDLPGNYDKYSEQFERDFGQVRMRDSGREVSAVVDENYHLVGSHIDDTIRDKIVSNQYVDFAKLLPKTRSMYDEDQRMFLYNKSGQQYWGPAQDRNQTIDSYFKWEQAFRVFCDVYTNRYPYRAGELIQYNHIIHTAALSFAWENVYTYDCEFRIHMSKNPTRKWGVILQQAYMMFIKDRARGRFNPQQSASSGTNSGSNGNQGPKKKVCYGFNAGKCAYGSRCRFDHRCGFCSKYGHGTHNCRKAQNNSQSTPSPGDRTRPEGKEVTTNANANNNKSK